MQTRVIMHVLHPSQAFAVYTADEGVPLRDATAIHAAKARLTAEARSMFKSNPINFTTREV